MTQKKYKAGMYGGKFMPMHLGHLACVRKASELCERVYLILFLNGEQEADIASHDDREMLSVESRVQQLERAAGMFTNVTPLVLDISPCRKPNGEEDWDKETPLVLEACGKFDAVFGSEPSYAAYFERAYPWAEYVMIDPERSETPISATMIREMKDTEEIKKWIV